MVFSPANNNKYQTPISIKNLNEDIEQIDHIKFLGVILDENLAWNKHSQHIATKISKNLGIITKARKMLNKESLLTLYIIPLFIHILTNAL